MDRFYWLINSNRSRIKSLLENTNNKDQFFKYMFIDSGKVTSTWGKESARQVWKKLTAQGWRITEEDWTKKESSDC